MKVDHINTDRDSTWHTRVAEERPGSSRARTAIKVEFKPHNGPKECGYFEPTLEAELLICFETTCASSERMLYITPDEIWLELRGRFLLQVSGVQQATPFPSFLLCQEYIEGILLLNLGRNGTFLIEAVLGHVHPASEPAPRGNLRMTIKFLDHCEHTGSPRDYH